MNETARTRFPVWERDTVSSPHEVYVNLVTEVVERVSPEYPRELDVLGDAVKSLRQMAHERETTQEELLAAIDEVQRGVSDLESGFNHYGIQRLELAILASRPVLDSLTEDLFKEWNTVAEEAAATVGAFCKSPYWRYRAETEPPES